MTNYHALSPLHKNIINAKNSASFIKVNLELPPDSLLQSEDRLIILLNKNALQDKSCFEIFYIWQSKRILKHQALCVELNLNTTGFII